MLRIAFRKSSSRYSQEALELATALGAVCDGAWVRLEFARAKIFQVLDQLYNMMSLIKRWKHVSVTWNEQEVDLCRFVWKLKRVRKCWVAKVRYGRRKHCWLSFDHKGWGCKYLGRIGRYYANKRSKYQGRPYWYNFGWIGQSGDWEIDVNGITEELIREANREGLFLCPFLDENKIDHIVSKELPSRIIIDGIKFRTYYQWGKPVNIRHIYSTAASEIRVREINELLKHKHLLPQYRSKLEMERLRLNRLFRFIGTDISSFDQDGNCLN